MANECTQWREAMSNKPETTPKAINYAEAENDISALRVMTLQVVVARGWGNREILIRLLI